MVTWLQLIGGSFVLAAAIIGLAFSITDDRLDR